MVIDFNDKYKVFYKFIINSLDIMWISGKVTIVGNNVIW
jgi:hypothetical protein